MNKNWFSFILFFFLFCYTGNIFAQCNEEEETKVLLVGDSWAFFQGVDGTIDYVFDKWGFPEYKHYTNLILAQNGAKTHHFLQAEKQNEIINQIVNNPSIEFVHLSIAGNDVLGNWKYESFSEAETDELVMKTQDSVKQIIEFIKSVDPKIKVVFGGYVYPNFEEVITEFGQNLFLSESDHPFYSNWEKMEFPPSDTINEMLIRFSDEVEDYYADDPRVIFVNAPGVAQYEYGQEEPLGVAPFGTYPKHSVPLPYGKPEYPSPQKSMRHYIELLGIEALDCFHLSKKGFRHMFGYTTQKYYHKALMDDKYFLAENAETNGSADSQGNASEKLFLGTDNGITHATILSFETYHALDSVPEKASLFLHRKSSIGDENPVDENLTLSIREGAFGNTAAVEGMDFQFAGDYEATPCIHGANDDGYWVRIDLPEEMVEYITNYDVTQFKITSTVQDGKVEFSGTEDPDFAPVLNIVYGNETYLAVEEETAQPKATVYPNPVTNNVHIYVAQGELIEVLLYSLEGRKVAHSFDGTLSMQDFPAGAYFAKIVTDKGVLTEKVIKK